jgi:ribosomal protein S18 acetylase RimI-like enzyme
MVHPDFQKRGIGTRLMQAIEAEFPQMKRFTLGTGHKSEDNLRLYHKLGYRPYSSERLNDDVTIVHLEKIRETSG